ncbi:hypothetical protein IE53DRAFT_386587 [Violaceomyces palustris]|uniref:Uncharacterized protein n=1 Tax=Violaceomyces palustris TaxID=1673888 RepID=A0ACD0NYY8_9BASI|nr:hypothetical protein IE53DRAFT_386587 [Violaceomyces palustris]
MTAKSLFLGSDSSDAMDVEPQVSNGADPRTTDFQGSSTAEEAPNEEVTASEGQLPTEQAAGSHSDRDDSQPGQMQGEGEDEAEPLPEGMIASLPVYLSTSLLPSSKLSIFQYPIYPRERPLPVPASAASRGLKVTCRWRPVANRLEVELPLDVRDEVYNYEKGVEMGEGAEMVRAKQAAQNEMYNQASGGGGADGKSGSKREKKEKEAERLRDSGPKKLDKSRLDSIEVPNATNYMVGVIRDQALHLTPLDSIVQLRPSMHYLDALDEAKEAEKRRDRAAAAGESISDEEDEADVPMSGPAKKKEEKKPAAQTLSVAMRADPNAKKPIPGAGSTEARDHLMAAQREADAERWLDIEWRHEWSDEAADVFQNQLFAQSKDPLECLTRPREYLDLD